MNTLKEYCVIRKAHLEERLTALKNWKVWATNPNHMVADDVLLSQVKEEIVLMAELVKVEETLKNL